MSFFVYLVMWYNVKMFKILDGGFLQSEEWRKFKEKTGLKTFLVEQDGKFYASILKQVLPLKFQYFFIPRGPFLDVDANIDNAIKELLFLAKKEKISWIRIEPQTFQDFEKIKKSLSYKIEKSPKNLQPPQTMILDLTKSEEELLMQMKEKTRYSVRLSSRKGVEFYETNSKSDFNEFLSLMKETAERNKINIQSDDYFKILLDDFKNDNVKLYVAKYDEKILSTMFMYYNNETATYLYGASSGQLRNLNASTGLYWHTIQEAKKKGFLKYDFWGTDIVKKDGNYVPKENNWKGISRIKLGFCPKCDPVDFPGTYDVVLKPCKYWLYRAWQKIKKNFAKK